VTRRHLRLIPGQLALPVESASEEFRRFLDEVASPPARSLPARHRAALDRIGKPRSGYWAAWLDRFDGDIDEAVRAMVAWVVETAAEERAAWRGPDDDGDRLRSAA
jgi:hypothetical protein